ncbi:antiviral reverse transcriptase Drt4 [Nocardia tengchongensis]
MATAKMAILGSSGFRSPSETQVKVGLLQFNYFPSMGKRRDELPPSITTSGLTSPIADDLLAQCVVAGKKVRKDFDAVIYDATRFNLVPRRLSIPHPLPYVRLVHTIGENWPNLKHLTQNKFNQFRPAVHGDGRLIAMNYGRQGVQNRILKRWIRFGSEYRVSADIANFYPGFYSHSIPWALVGHDTAKRNRGPSHWYNEVDMRFRDCNRGETHGLHVGPGTSALGADVVLTAIDEIMKDQGYSYIRYIDDYEYYARDRKDAEEFVLNLSAALSSYGLKLNSAKTRIEELPLPDNPNWMRQLIPQVPKASHFSRLEPYLEEAVELAKVTPDGSVLKFAVDAVLKAKDIGSRADEILPCLFNISFHNPGILPEVGHILDMDTVNVDQYSEVLNTLLRRHARFRRSDGTSWVLHIMRSHGIKVSDDVIDDLVKMGDCIPLTLLHATGQGNASAAVEQFAKKQLLAIAIGYDIDRNWVLYYELFRQGVISNPYAGDPNDANAATAFDVLVDHNVSFLN